MKYLQRTGILLVIFSFVFQSISVPISAMTNDEQNKKVNLQTATILLDENEENVPLYEEDSETSEILLLLQSEEQVIVLERFADFSYVEYIQDNNSEESLHGFILNDFLNSSEDEIPADIQTATILLDENEEYTPLYEENSETSEILLLLQSEEQVVVLETLTDFSYVEYVNINENDVVLHGFINNDFLEFESFEYTEDLNDDSDKNSSSDKEDSLIQENEVIENIDDEDDSEDPSTSDDISKDEKDNELASSNNSQVNEDKTAKEDTNSQIETKDQEINSASNLVMRSTSIQKSLEGVALKDSTSVYVETSTNSKALKTYPAGSILKYSIDLSLKDWYRTGVYINGVKQTGYIHKSHVENAIDNQVLLEGIALKSSTPVYTRASTSSMIRKSYAAGSILKYYTYSENWYKTGVYINGVKQTGYIHKSHVEGALEKPVLLEGVALKNSTPVYTKASSDSKVRKSYPTGSILKFYTYSKNWYRTGVYVNGVKQTSYIRKSDVDTATNDPKYNKGIAIKQPTTVYSSASINSKALKSYSTGSTLIYYTYSNDWYRTGVYINGIKITGYIHKSHVSEKIETNYNIDLKEAADIQVKANGQTDKKYKTFVHKDYVTNNKVNTSTLNVRGGPGTNYWVVGQLKINDNVKIIKTTGDWYEIEFSKDHQWVNASPEDVAYYLDPKNFINDPIQRFQFLDLSKASSATVASLNTYLTGKGILQGRGQAFLDAGRTHNVNDVYLMSHALLETGNGTSKLATGNEVGLNSSGKATFVTSSNKAQLRAIKTVYNMYGIGANDGCALECGSIKAYVEGWTTPELAIIDGAKFIGEKYIHGHNNTNTVQNTLYKMRWNPEYMERTNNAGHQYATDIGWASKQVSRISSIYEALGNDFIILDIPIYR